MVRLNDWQVILLFGLSLEDKIKKKCTMESVEEFVVKQLWTK